MSIEPINWLAVLASVVAMQAIGALWYSPVLFAKPWQKAVGMKPGENPAPGPAMINAVVLSIVTSIAMAILVGWTGAEGLADALMLGLVVAVGFCIAVIGTNAAFEGRPMALVLINAGHYLADILAITVILTLWK
ncbi:MAG: DUF1761 domain-containing protein [Alphaproteobacteria bacterium]